MKRTILAGLALAALATGSAATSAADPMTSSRAAAPVVADVVVDPVDTGVRVALNTAPQAQRQATSTAAAAYLYGYSEVNGARVRSQPVTGWVRGTLYYRDSVRIMCYRRASDGYDWLFLVTGRSGAGIYGWVRSDLIFVGWGQGPLRHCG